MITFLCLNIYIGWIDDIISILLFNGEVINEPSGFLNLVIHNQIGYIFSTLYRYTNGINWFGLIMLVFAFVSVLNLNILLLQILAPKKIRGYILYFILVTMLFSAFIIENVFILNYTRISILLAFISLLSIAYIYRNNDSIRANKRLYIYYLICFYVGLSIRPTVILLFIPIFFLFGFVYFSLKKMLKANLALFVFLTSYIVISWIVTTPNQKTIVRQMLNSESYIINILDGYNTNEIEHISPADSIKIEALNSWCFADQDSLLDKNFLNKYGANHPFNNLTLKQCKENIQEEIKKSKSNYTEKYLPELNYYWKAIWLISIIAMFPFLMFAFKTTNKQSFIKLVGYLTLVFLYLATITALVKMEDRVLTPILIFIFISVLVATNKLSNKNSKSLVLLLTLLFTIISFLRFDDYFRISKQRNLDLQQKEKVRNEIKHNFGNRYVVFDLYTISFLETSPFKDVNFPDNWVSGVEVWNRHKYESSIISDIVGCQDWPCYFIEVSKRQHEFIFFFKSDRVQIIKDYYKLVYGIDLRFKKVSRNLLINDFHYSFHWIPFDYGYYQLQDIQLYDTSY